MVEIYPPHLSFTKRPHSVNIGQIEYPHTQKYDHKFERISTHNPFPWRGKNGKETPIGGHPDSYLNTLDEMIGKSHNSLNLDGISSRRYAAEKSLEKSPNALEKSLDKSPPKNDTSLDFNKSDTSDPIARVITRRKTDFPLKKGDSFYELRKSKSKFYKKLPGKLETRPEAYKLNPKNVEEIDVRLSLATREYALKIEEEAEERENESGEDLFDYPEDRKEMSSSPPLKNKQVNYFKTERKNIFIQEKENNVNYPNHYDAVSPLRSLKNSEVIIELPNQLSPGKELQKTEFKFQATSRNSIQKPTINLSMVENTPIAGMGGGNLLLPYMSPTHGVQSELKPQDILERINSATQQLDKVAASTLALADELKNKYRKNKSEEKE